MLNGPKPSKENAMLVDIQYVKPDRKKGQNDDYLYVIWRNLDTGKKYLITQKNPVIPIYFEKEEYRDQPQRTE